MDTIGRSLKTTFLTLLCFYFILIIKCIALKSQTWYVVTIDLNLCSNCGKVIISMGTLLEQKLGVFDDKENVNEVSMDIIHRSREHSLYGTSTERTYEKRNDDQISLFRIENEIRIYAGLWNINLCTEDGKNCVDLDIDLAPSIFARLPLLRNVQENIITARQFFLLSSVIAVLTSLFATINFTMSTSTTAVILFMGGLASAFVSLTGVVIASLSLFEAFGVSDVVIFRAPAMLVTTLLTDYVTLMTVFSVWRTWESHNKTSIQTWFEKNIRNV